MRTIPYTPGGIRGVLNSRRSQGAKIVLTCGCFDILHPGHIATLEYAKRQGDILVVAVNSDSSVKQNKGEHRPIIGEKDRATVLDALEVVDLVLVFGDKTAADLILSLSPHCFVKGDSSHPVVDEVNACVACQCRMVWAESVSGYSTTEIEGRIKSETTS